MIIENQCKCPTSTKGNQDSRNKQLNLCFMTEDVNRMSYRPSNSNRENEVIYERRHANMSLGPRGGVVFTSLPHHHPPPLPWLTYTQNLHLKQKAVNVCGSFSMPSKNTILILRRGNCPLGSLSVRQF